MISIQGLSYFIGGRALYENASLHIKPKDKIGLIGLNGKGKSTLLRIIDGEYQLDAGSISKSNDTSIGFLNQDHLSYQSDESILSVTMEAFKDAVKLQREIDHILKTLETDYDDKLVERLSKYQEKFEVLGGYSIQAKAEEVLEGIGFKTSDLQRPLAEFSGGWRMRVMLAKLLLEKPSLLMLDEPTNHLDLPSIKWLENYLWNYEGAFIIVSHDRQFLDNTTNKTVEVALNDLIVYEGNYSFYLEEKELRKEIQKNAFENQQQKIRQTERFIERFRAKSTKARQVQSKVKSLDRMDMIEDVVDENASINFRFQVKRESGRFPVEIEHVSKSYGTLDILKDANIRIEKGDKIALLGANGKGKSTLLRIIGGDEEHEGECKIGYNVIPAFYAQHQLESLQEDNEILEEMKQAGSEKTEQELRNLLGCFLFSGDDVLKKIKVLSGGEKSRVALAKTLLTEANFLLLDEPTNHLDFISENILINALNQYEGTFLIVSHNRHFVSKTANKIWYIEDQQVKEYPGSYSEYEYWLEKNNGVQDAVEPKKKKEKKANTKPKSSESEKKLKKLHSELNQAEKEVQTVEEQIKLKEEELAQPEVYGNPERLEAAQNEYAQLKTTKETAQENWERIFMLIDDMETP